MRHTPPVRGERFGRLVAMDRAVSLNGRIHWQFRCDCGQLYSARLNHVRSGRIVSCGCFWQEQVVKAVRAANTKHGMTKTPEWKTWNELFQRCDNSNSHNWKRYGGRGIRVCKRWLEFEGFYADMGPRPSAAHSIDRIDNNGNYEPGNCRWATSKQQAANRRPRERALP